jgi:hypothetical protein
MKTIFQVMLLGVATTLTVKGTGKTAINNLKKEMPYFCADGVFYVHYKPILLGFEYPNGKVVEADLRPHWEVSADNQATYIANKQAQKEARAISDASKPKPSYKKFNKAKFKS